MICFLWFGFAGGLLAGTGVGLAEAVWVLSQVPTGEYMALLHASVLYSLLGAVIGLGVGALLALTSLALPRLGDAMAMSLAAVLVTGGMGGYVLVQQLDRAVYLDLGLGLAGRLQVGGLVCVVVVLGLWLGPVFLTRTPLKILLLPRGTLAAWGASIGLAALFALAPGDDPTLVTMDPRQPPPTDLGDTPDVVLVSIEDWRMDATPRGALGLDLPNLARLERDAVCFDQLISTSSWRRPALASLMTGELPEAHGVDTISARMEADRVTLAELLQDRGYVTGSAAARGELERALGFDQGFDWSIASATPRTPMRSESVRHLMLASLLRDDWRRLRRIPPERSDLHRPAAEVVAQAQGFMARSRQEGSRSMAWLHLAEPSVPYFSADGQQVAEARDPAVLDDAARAQIRRLYGEEVQAMDAALGQLIDGLQAQGVWEDTLLVVVGTSGVELFDHGAWGEGDSLYDEALRTPLYIKLPGQRWAGAHVPWQVSLLDVGPTILDLTGTERPAPWEGLPLLDIQAAAWLQGEEGASAPKLEPAVAQLHRHGALLDAIRAPPLKLIRANRGNPRGLPTQAVYDLVADPGETVNLAGQLGAEQVALSRELREILVRSASWRTVPAVPGPSAAAPSSAP